jgi:hypothetical protein
MRFLRIFVPLLSLAPVALAQLTPAQKTADFMQLVGLYAKNYAPYELRRDLFGFDLYNVQPWLTQINQSTDDVTFYDIITRYVASLQDSHDEVILPSDYDAWLHMDTDIYDGNVLIGDIDRTYLPKTKYPFVVGDQIVSVDGVAAADLIQSFIPYAVNGSANKTSQMRLAAGVIMERYQGWNPKAPQIGATATVVVKRQNGNVETYTIPWDKTGTAIVTVGPVPSPQAAVSPLDRSATRDAIASRRPRLPQRRNAWGTWQGAPAAIEPDPVPAYMQAEKKLQYGKALASAVPVSAGIDPYGNNFLPVFNPPAGFKLRLGSRSTDQFLSGTFPMGNFNIGYIRIPTMEPPSESTAFTQFVNEIIYFSANTDGLVVDVMANGGGDGCYSGTLASALIPYTFRGLALQLRATQNWVLDFSEALTSAEQQAAPQWVINLYTLYLQDVQQALSQNRGLTGNLPVCDVTFDTLPITDINGHNLAYTKPILLLTDNFTLSAAEVFTMFMQDTKRATIFGTRTDGGGGNVVEYDGNATDYSEASARVTESLITRAQPVATPGFPAGQYSQYYDGQGIYPDIVQDYQTLDNLLNGGTTFVKAFSTAIANLIQGH